MGASCGAAVGAHNAANFLAMLTGKCEPNGCNHTQVLQADLSRQSAQMQSPKLRVEVGVLPAHELTTACVCFKIRYVQWSQPGSPPPPGHSGLSKDGWQPSSPPQSGTRAKCRWLHSTSQRSGSAQQMASSPSIACKRASHLALMLQQAPLCTAALPEAGRSRSM